MGTRGAVGFVANGKWYVTYNHFDSYPSELGMSVLEFCKTITDWEYLKSLVEKIKLVDEDVPVPADLIEKYQGYGVTHGPGGVVLHEGTLTNWYNLLRDLQNGRILYEISVGNVSHMIDDHRFLGDSLFCEWAYIIDLDEMTLNVYKGFNKESQADTPLPPDIDPLKKDEDYHEYYPVKLLHAYNLNRLPEFMLGVTNEFKKAYRLAHQEISVK